MTGTKEIDNILSSAIAIGTPAPSTPSKPKATPHKAGKTIASSKKRTWKKPKDKPKRPLSAYNLFFKEERARIVSGSDTDSTSSSESRPSSPTVAGTKRKHRKSHGKIGFAALAQTISKRWKSTDAATRRPFEAKAAIEKARYRKELDVWHKMQAEKKRSEPTTESTAASTTPSQPAARSSYPKKGQHKKPSTRPTQKMLMKETIESTSRGSSQQQEAGEAKASVSVPLSFPSNMPFYPMNLRGMPTTANIAPITLQSILPFMDTSSNISILPSTLNTSSLLIDTSSTAIQATASPMAMAITPDVTPIPSPSCHISDDADILSDLDGSIESILDDFGDLPSLPVFPAMGDSSGSIGQDKTINDTLPAMDKLMNSGEFSGFLSV
mmetsp:Transcript_18283/g.39877  ORF Transcript_18283/g.39877 Transcript_18283/m.39877 type:complete len:383 (-) Transcript_18283:114-1262(-)|eukprot:CAMPEP_0178602324 /NCGR_PEP_ID=MMETSP0697-20121206/34900_1 /TAXON_ID=265572 /ORGANISM="Extubocellulus spinifer, Strain CCMP396" /LENGTH=382 /DNA_ID=CAMNT_0020240521 /DNA_START=279 /DNA_END=1427 /DNA_ORIENTATION=+